MAAGKYDLILEKIKDGSFLQDVQKINDLYHVPNFEAGKTLEILFPADVRVTGIILSQVGDDILITLKKEETDGTK